MDEKIQSGLQKVLGIYFDEVFRGELHFPRFRILSYDRRDDKTYQVRLELIYLDCHNDTDPLLVNEDSISNPVLPKELIHMINSEVITWDTKEEADALSLEPSLIDVQQESEESLSWDDLRVADEEIKYALSAAGLDKYDISQDEKLNELVMNFLNSSEKSLEKVRLRLRPFLID